VSFEKTVFADRSDRGKLRVAGPQAAWFLDQILTQSFEGITPGDARPSAILTVHGRMIAFLEAVATDNAILCHYEPELREVVPETLNRYLLATDATLEDITDAFGLVLIAGPDWNAAAESNDAEVVLHETQELGSPAGYVWVARGEADAFIDHLRSNGALPVSEAELEAERIANGVARWGHEMDPKTFPQEAGIDERAVQFEKGCYLGQEAMAKIHFRGKVNRRLARVRGEGALEVGAEVTLDGNKIGSLTSAANGTGLAIVRWDVPEGAAVKVGPVDATLAS
jgi:tRNA-modifying protein YgfZ